MLVACIITILSVVINDTGCTSCDTPLGMEDRRIRDGQLLSKGSGGGTIANDSRIGNVKGWCSHQSNDIRESTYVSSAYLQIDLLDVHKITKLNITGSKNHKNYVPGVNAQLSYRVDQSSEYIVYETPLNISGIKFPNTRALKLEPPIVARYLKYQPQIDANSKCVTMEIYGCPLPDSSCQNGMLKQSMKYSATATETSLHASYIAAGISSLPWGPGKTSAAFGDSVTISLKNKYLITGVETYQPRISAVLKKQPNSFLLSYSYDNINRSRCNGGSTEKIKFNTSKTLGNIVRIIPTIAAQYISICPEQSLHRYLKMQIHGCLLSDQTVFDVKTPSLVTSDPVTSPHLTTTKKASTVKSKTTDLFSTTSSSKIENTSLNKLTTKTIEGKDKTIKEKNPTTHKSPLNVTSEKDKSNLTLIIVIIVLVVVLVAVIVLFLVFLYRKRWRSSWRNMRYARNNKRSNSNGKQNNSEDNHLMTNLSKTPIYEVSFKNGNDETCHLYAEVPGDLGETDDNNPQSEIKEERPSVIEHMEEPDDYYSGLAENNKGYAQVIVEPNTYDVVPVYAEPDAQASEDIELNPIYGLSSGDDDSQIYEKAKSLYERAKIYEDPYQNVTGSSLYADPDVIKERASFEVREFPRDRLRFLEKIGTGQFGEVHICEVESLGSIIGSDESQCSWIMSSTIKVAVKMLKSDVEKNIEKEFMKEVRVMARLQHENVVKLLGVCKEEPKCMVVEYMENGDLNQFIKGYSLTDGFSDTSTKLLNEQTLLYMSLQICGGMKYLSSQGFVHRDLATRNCLVGHSFTVKISDFGMSRYLYSKHYYRIEGRAVLPIRWMAPESLFYGTFTSQSDVWAFGVTLWEIFTFARETPYEMMTDQQVIENACSIVAKEQRSFRCLPRPPICSDHLYKLLLNCWKKSPAERPNFNELTQFFKRLVNSVEDAI